MLIKVKNNRYNYNKRWEFFSEEFLNRGIGRYAAAQLNDFNWARNRDTAEILYTRMKPYQKNEELFEIDQDKFIEIYKEVHLLVYPNIHIWDD